MQILKKLTPVALTALILTPKRKEKITAKFKKKKNGKKRIGGKKRGGGKKAVCKQRFRFN